MDYLKKVSYPLLLIPVLLFTLGFITLLSVSPESAKDQLAFFILGCGICFVFSHIDIIVYKYVWKYGYALLIALLMFTYFFGKAIFGASRWIQLGFFTFQPSEVGKIVLILALATFISANMSSIKHAGKLFHIGLIALPPILLVFLQPDLGTSLVMVATVAGMLFFSEMAAYYFIFFTLVLGALSKPAWNFLQDYQRERILVFLNPSLDLRGSGYNVFQALIAIGSGGLLGKGYLHGTQAHMNYLPSHLTDFIFSAFAEEWGFIGVALFVVLYVVFLYTLLHYAYAEQDPYKSLVIFGVFMVFFVQFAINVGMNLGIMPVTGIPLPFVSYGGTSLVVSFMLIGLVQSVRVH